MINNVADKDLPPDPSMPVLSKRKADGGKYGAFGLPGGGVKTENFEKPIDGVIREFEGESGLRVATIDLLLGRFGKVIYTKGARTTTEMFPFTSNGNYPPPNREKLRQGWKLDCVNPFFVFLMEPLWEGSAHQWFFQELMDKRLNGGWTKDRIEREALWTDLDEAQKKELGISEEESPEIRGIGLFPISYIERILDLYDQEKDRGKPGIPYFSHMSLIHKHRHNVLHWLRREPIEPPLYSPPFD